MDARICRGRAGGNGRRTECANTDPLTDAAQPQVDISGAVLEMREWFNFPSGIIGMEAGEVGGL